MMPAAQDEGYLAKILVGDGAKDIPVGTLVAIVVDEKDDVRSRRSHTSGGIDHRPCGLKDQDAEHSTRERLVVLAQE